jgi:hypothetical protein
MPLSQRALQFTISRAKCPLPGWTIVNASPSGCIGTCRHEVHSLHAAGSKIQSVATWL